MATLLQIRTKVDTFLADLWTNVIVPKEEAYFALHGRYAQVLVSPTVIPADDTTASFVKRPPSDENFVADFDFTIATPIPAQMQIYTHDKGEEHGFTAHVYVQVLGKIYHRAKVYQSMGANWKGVWVEGTYNEGERVSHLGKNWVASRITTSEPVEATLTVPSDWSSFTQEKLGNDVSWHEVIPQTI